MIDLDYARQVLEMEAEAIRSLRVTDAFGEAAGRILECTGRVIATGMGKAGIIAMKAAATFASTGTPALHLHPAEAAHGDLGRVRPEDVVLAFSNSGETEEILRLLPAVKRIGAAVIAVTGCPESTLARDSEVTLDIGEIDEACPLGLAPSASTAAMLALSDALALAVFKAHGFTAEDYALWHPGGELGRKLLRVREIMRTGEASPCVAPETPVVEVLEKISGARAGAACVVDAEGKLVGFFTDGDFRRAYAGAPPDSDIREKPVCEFMTCEPRTTQPDRLASEALATVNARKVDELPVVDKSGRVVGVLDVQDILAARRVE